jgi:lipopolysaccharide transport system ATP-binding protein
MSSDTAIQVTHLSKCYQIYDKPSDRLKQTLMRGRKNYYREFWALNDISFSIQKGETVGIIGRNGSGKSTLLQMVCGTLNPTNGQIQTHGRIAALLELGSGFNPEFSGRENIYLNGTILGLTHREIEARYADIVAFADIGQFIDQPVKTYSSGMVVRLAFAVIAHVDADILIIDEALSVGDAFFTQKCMRFLRRFMDNGTVLFVSHDTAAVKNLCTRCIWLNNGVIAAQGPSKEVTELYLQDYYAQIHESAPSDATTVPDTQATADTTIPARIYRDQRQDLFNNSNLRNDIRLFQFDIDAPSFGTGAAKIVSVEFQDTQERALNWVVGGENVCLRILVAVGQNLTSPIVGFVVKDRLGQALFGDNTYLSFMDKPVHAMSGQILQAQFQFVMPRLMNGEYTLTVAIADGTQEEHVQHQWIFDAMTFRSESTNAATGLVGIPFMDIRLNVHAQQI